jgi:hypothetical protein
VQGYGYPTCDLPGKEENYMNMKKVNKFWHESVMPFLIEMFLCLQEVP